MKFSELWLREWVNPAITSEALSEQLTMAGLEVESVVPVAAAFHGVVVGEVMTCIRHPDADKLQVTKVNTGGNQLLNIVCGAANCRQGLKVAVATVGAVLPGEFKIKAAKLRGESSEGMLCSFAELGINADAEGIIELPADAPVGRDIRDYLQLDDNIIEINVTPNRADCLGILGVARDVAVINQMIMNQPEKTAVTAMISDALPIQIEVSKACPRYLGRVVKGINIKAETPLWMREKLRRSGFRSVDAVVDITNFVLLESGQPMHAFDLDRIDSGIVVRMAREGETLTLLDGKEARLDCQTLVIADQHNVLALAGISGGIHSGVNTQTQDVFLECAFFHPLAITGRARRYGLHTEASHRYERGVDSRLQDRAMERATQLLLKICGGKAGPIVDNTNQAGLPASSVITLRREKLNKLIGHFISDQQVTDSLQRLGCELTACPNGWQVITPSWRFDTAIEEDLIEEVARVYGYHNIPSVPLQANLLMTRHREASLSLKRAKILLTDKGYQEGITYSFVDPKIQSLLHVGKESLILPHPISLEMSAMRLSLWSGLLSAAVYNQHRQQTRIRLFESGLRFVPDPQADLGIRQEMVLSAVLSGKRNEEHWDMARTDSDFYDLKGDLESVLDLTGKLDLIAFRAESHSALHPGQSAAIYLNGERVGYIGVIHPELERKLDFNSRMVVFEVLWNRISERTLPAARELSRFPANRRDIAVIVAENISAADVISECKKVSVNQVVGVNLFDVYRGKGVNDGYKSLAISLILQDTHRTLEEEEIAATVSRCVEALKERFQASLRD